MLEDKDFIEFSIEDIDINNQRNAVSVAYQENSNDAPHRIPSASSDKIIRDHWNRILIFSWKMKVKKGIWNSIQTLSVSEERRMNESIRNYMSRLPVICLWFYSVHEKSTTKSIILMNQRTYFAVTIAEAFSFGIPKNIWQLIDTFGNGLRIKNCTAFSILYCYMKSSRATQTSVKN